MPLDFLRVCYSAVMTVSGLLRSDCFSGRVSGDFVMATDSDAQRRGPGLAPPLVSHWKFLGTLRRLMRTFIWTVRLIWTQSRTSWACSGCSPGSTREGCTECTHIDSRSVGPGEGISQRNHRGYGGLSRASKALEA